MHPTELRLVTLDNVYANLYRPEVADLFAGMMRARASGYGSFYSA
jgi:hypothetical protein